MDTKRSGTLRRPNSKNLDSAELTQTLVNKLEEAFSLSNANVQLLMECYNRVAADVSKLEKIIRDGNGTPSLTSQVLLLNEKIKTLDSIGQTLHESKLLGEKFKNLESSISEVKTQIEKTAQLRWAVWLAVLSGIFSIAAVIIQRLLEAK